ncbi:MAG: TPM domain-containing protein [Saprospiraceae bacterium]
MVKFFTKEEGDRIVETIRIAELNTSGEIRVHLEVGCRNRTFEDAVKIFNKLGMKETKQRNGILFLIVPERREFSIYGDVGIHNNVPEGYWAEVIEHVQYKFRAEEFVDGICDGVAMVGDKLKEYFPYKNNDKNELSNEISYG